MTDEQAGETAADRSFLDVLNDFEDAAMQCALAEHDSDEGRKAAAAVELLREDLRTMYDRAAESAPSSDEASAAELDRLLMHCVRDYKDQAYACDTPQLERRRAYAEQTAHDLADLRKRLPGLVTARYEAELWGRARSAMTDGCLSCMPSFDEANTVVVAVRMTREMYEHLCAARTSSEPVSSTELTER